MTHSEEELKLAKKLYSEAGQLETEMRETWSDWEKFLKGLSLYEAAYARGCLEAGVELARLLIITEAERFFYDDGPKFPGLADRYIAELKICKHPAADYLEALQLFATGCVDGGKVGFTKMQAALELLMYLEEQGNVYVRSDSWRGLFLNAF